MALLMRPLRKPVSLRVFGGAYELYLESRSKPTQSLIRRLFSLAHRVVVQPRLVAEALRPIWPEQIRCVRNYRVAVADQAPRQFDAKSVRFIFGGNIRRTKGCGELFLAFADARRQLAERQCDVRIALDMYGPEYSVPTEVVDGIDAARRDPDIAFHGNVPNSVFRQALERADVFVYPSYWPTEGHSGAIVEAMFFGLPIIASDWRANTEVVQDGINGLICKHKDVASLADCMVRLAMNVELRRNLSASALQAADQYDAAVVCPELAEALGL